MNKIKDMLIRLVIFVFVSVVVWLVCRFGTWANSLFSLKTEWYWTFYNWMGIVVGILLGVYSAVMYEGRK